MRRAFLAMLLISAACLIGAGTRSGARPPGSGLPEPSRSRPASARRRAATRLARSVRRESSRRSARSPGDPLDPQEGRHGGRRHDRRDGSEGGGHRRPDGARRLRRRRRRRRPEGDRRLVGASTVSGPAQPVVLLRLLARRRGLGVAHAPLPVRGRDSGAGALGPFAARSGGVRLPAAGHARRRRGRADHDAAAVGVRRDVDDRLLRVRTSRRDVPRSRERARRRALHSCRQPVPRLRDRLVHRRGIDRAVAGADGSRGRGLRDRADAAAVLRGARVAGPSRMGDSIGRAAGGADPVEVRDRRRARAGRQRAGSRQRLRPDGVSRRTGPGVDGGDGTVGDAAAPAAPRGSQRRCRRAPCRVGAAADGAH